MFLNLSGSGTKSDRRSVSDLKRLKTLHSPLPDPIKSPIFNALILFSLPVDQMNAQLTQFFTGQIAF